MGTPADLPELRHSRQPAGFPVGYEWNSDLVERPFLGHRHALAAHPQNFFSLLVDSTMNAHDHHLTSASVGFLVRDPRERSSRESCAPRNGPRPGYPIGSFPTAPSRKWTTALIPLADTISTFYVFRYDALASKFLEKTGGFRLASQCQCWIADVLVTNTINPEETLVRFQITLVGLGSIGRVR
jgi:hypothetical protein